jgi:hypothetical protein
MSNLQSLGENEGDADVVDLCEGSMDNDDQHFSEEV